MSERRRRRGVSEALTPLVPLVLVWAVGVAGLAVVALQRRVSRADLFLDPAHSAGLPWYTGMVSNIGVLMWTVGATFAGIGAFVAHLGGRRAATRFLAAGCGVGTLLGLNDLFQLHSELLPRALGVSKPVVLSLYLLIALVWVRTSASEIRRTRWPILFAAAAAFGVSIVFDQLNTSGGELALLAEDGPKQLGIMAWALYFGTTVVDITRSVVRGAAQAGGRGSAVAAEPGGELVEAADHHAAGRSS